VAKWSRNPDVSAESQGIALTAEEGFVLSRLDTPLTRDEVVEQTGLPVERIDNIMALLEDKQLAVSDEPPLRLAAETIPDLDPDGELAAEDDETPVAGLPIYAGPVESVASAEAAARFDTPPEPPFDPRADPPSDPSPPAPPESRPNIPLELDPNVLDPSFKQIYDRDLSRVPFETRIALSGTATGMTLLALCHDPEPAVVSAILMNPDCVPSHARIIALNHTNPLGLEQIARRGDLLADPQIEWLLLRNPMLPEELARYLLAPKQLIEMFELWADEVVADAARAIARDAIRTKFNEAPPNERADLITRTEGNALSVLVGLTLDGRTVTILCSRQYTSPVFVRNIIKFTACPGALLGYLWKQSLVRRNPQLRNMLLQHPNLPAELKRLR